MAHMKPQPMREREGGRGTESQKHKKEMMYVVVGLDSCCQQWGKFRKRPVL